MDARQNSIESQPIPVGVLPNDEGLESIQNETNRAGGLFRGRLSSCWLPILGFCNTIGLVGIGIVVAFLFVQLQYVTYKLNAEQKQMAELMRQVQDQQAGQIQELSQQVEQQKDYTVYQIAGTFTLLVCLLTVFHMASHVRNLYEPIVQRKILAILWMSPIYSVTSFFSLCLPKTEGYLSIIKDFYEAYVIYTFLSFLIAVLGRGNRDVVVQLLARHVDHLDEPSRFLRRLYDAPPETSDLAKANAVLTECQIFCMQFVFIRPVTSIMSFLVFALSNDNSNNDDDIGNYFLSPYFAIAMIENVSVFFAFRGLLHFYHAVCDELAWLQPFNKFLAIKGIVFLTFWQGLLISIIVQLHGHVNDSSNDSGSTGTGSGKDPHEQAVAIQNLLICVEMLFFSLAHVCVFPAEEWEPGYRPKEYARPGLGIKDFAKDVKSIMGRNKHHGAVPVPQYSMEMDLEQPEAQDDVLAVESNQEDDDDKLL